MAKRNVQIPNKALYHVSTQKRLIKITTDQKLKSSEDLACKFRTQFSHVNSRTPLWNMLKYILHCPVWRLEVKGPHP